MIDAKKLITGFLIVATAAVSSGLILSLVSNSLSTPTANAAPQVTITDNADDAIAGNAFTPAEINQIVAEVAPELASSTMLVTSTDPSNLTDDLATEFVNGVVVANPTGPVSTDADGNPTFTPPDVNELAAQIADSTTTTNLQIPDWDIEAASIPMTVVATSSATALTNYGNALNDIMNSHLDTNTQVQSILSDDTGSADISDLAYLETQVQSTLQDVSSLSVPTPAVAYQKSLVTDLVYEKNLLQLNDVAQTDPVKAALVFQSEDNTFYSVQTEFLDQAQDLADKTVSLEQASPKAQNLLLSFLSNTFGMQAAHAQVIVSDPPLEAAVTAAVVPELTTQTADLSGISIPLEDANQQLQLTDHAVQVQSSASLFGLISSIHVQNMGQKLEDLLKNTLLQILKNTLVAIIQREVLTWIQGSGAPRFITNWGTQLVNAAQTSALNAINSQMSCGTFSGFVGQEKITLNAFYKPGNNVCANQFAAALGSNSFAQFYNNFKNGGFVAFGASTLPSGNPYGSLFFNAQTVAFAYQNQQAASQLKAQTSQGLTGNQVCSDGSDPINGQHTICESTLNNTNGDDYPLPAGQTSCSSGFTPVLYDNNGLCGNGSQPIVTTPAAATGFVLGSAIDATPKQLSAANDIVGVLNAVLNSLLTSLASTAVNAAGQLVNQGLTSLNGQNITNGATTAAPTPIPLACNPTSQIVPSITAGNGAGLLSASDTASASGVPSSTSPTSLSATGGTTDSNGNPPAYYWSDSNGVTSTGAFFSDVFANPGTYTVTLGDSASDTPATCTVTVQP